MPIGPARRPPVADPTDPSFLDASLSAAEGFFTWFDRPGQVVRNVLRGDLGAAGRQLGDFGLDAIDAVLPGDMIGARSRPTDYVSTSDLVGMPQGDDFWSSVGRFGVDLVGDTLTNPLSFVTAGGAGAAVTVGRQLGRVGTTFGNASRAAGKVAGGADELIESAARTAAERVQLDALPKLLEKQLTRQGRASAQQSIDDVIARAGGDMSRVPELLKGNRNFDQGGLKFFGQQIMAPDSKVGKAIGAVVDPIGTALLPLRSATGNLSIDPASRAMLDDAKGEGMLVSAGNQKAVEQFLRKHKLSPDERRALVEAVHGVRGRERVAGETVADRIAALSQETGLDRARLQSAADDLFETIGRPQWEQGVQKGIFSGDTAGGVEEYLPRAFKGQKADEIGREVDELSGEAAATRSRKLQTPDEVADFLKQNPDVELETDLEKLLIGRARQQGQLAERARLAKRFIGDDATLSDPVTKQAIGAVLEEVKKAYPDLAVELTTRMKGLPPRKGLTKILAAANRDLYFKKAAVMGVGVPRMAGMMRNRLGGLMQALTEDGALAGANATRIASDFTGALADGLHKAFGTSVSGDRLGRAFRTIDDTFAKHGINTDAAVAELAKKDKHLAEAVRLGVLDNFTKSEDLLNEMSLLARKMSPAIEAVGLDRAVGKESGARAFQDLLDWPAEMFQGLESRMRLGTFLDARKRGMSAERAAQVVNDAYLDYSVVSPANRTVRDLIPFAAFLMKSIPQQAKWVAKNPAVGVAASNLFEGDVEPWQEGKTRVPIGKDEQGNPQYLMLNAPLDVLSLMPSMSTLGADARRAVVASSQPLLKSGFAELSGRDPYFDSPVGSYDKTPYLFQALGAPESGAAAANYHRFLSGTGLAQPITGPIQQIGSAIDPRKSATERVLSGLVGLDLRSVDPLSARESRLRRRMEADPRNFRQSTSFYTRNEEDEAVQSTLDLYRETKRQRMEQAAPVGY